MDVCECECEKKGTLRTFCNTPTTMNHARAFLSSQNACAFSPHLASDVLTALFRSNPDANVSLTEVEYAVLRGKGTEPRGGECDAYSYLLLPTSHSLPATPSSYSPPLVPSIHRVLLPTSYLLQVRRVLPCAQRGPLCLPWL